MHSLHCMESTPVAETVLLLAQVMRDESPPQSGSCSSGSSLSSPSSEGNSRRDKHSSDESTTTACRRTPRSLRRRNAAKQAQITISYTEGTTLDGEEWNLANGFPFPCPVLRDPANDGALYVPGEVLRFHLNQSSRSGFTSAGTTLPLSQPRRRDSSVRERKAMKIEAKEKTISLREVIRQVPIRLAHYRDGSFDKSLYDAWLYGDPREPLRDRFARMDRALRSKFIGLKNSSARVREKVRQKKMTTYKEVAEELVEEIGLADATDKRSALEAENLKRRVYDVLNVFEAVGLIKKDQKNVFWRGNAVPEERDVQQLQSRVDLLKKQLEERQRYLKQIHENYKALYALAERNKQRPEEDEDIKLLLPFFLIHAPESTPVDITSACHGRQMQFDFHGREFCVSGDMWVLRRMQLHCWDASPSRFFETVFAASHSNRTEPELPNDKCVLLPVSDPTQSPQHSPRSDFEDKANPFDLLPPDNGMDVAVKMEELESCGENVSLQVATPMSRKRTWLASSQTDCVAPEPPPPLPSLTINLPVILKSENG